MSKPPFKHKDLVTLNPDQVAAYNAFFAICATSTDPNVTAGLLVLEVAIDDSETGEKQPEPPGDVP